MKVWEDRIIAWAETRPDIRAAFVVGSYARRDHPADPYSDLDLVLFSNKASEYRQSREWLRSIGVVLACVEYPQTEGGPEYLVLFDDEGPQIAQVDFAFMPVEKLQALAGAAELPEVYQRGYRVIVDRDGVAARIPPSPFAAPKNERPTEVDFRQAVDTFWFYALQVAQSIRRRDLWVAKIEDRMLKDNLLRIMEWHTQAVRGADTWHSGRFIKEWVDPHTWVALLGVYGRFDAVDSWRSLVATMNLFRRLAVDTASFLGFSYPIGVDQEVTHFVTTMRTGDREMPPPPAPTHR